MTWSIDLITASQISNLTKFFPSQEIKREMRSFTKPEHPFHEKESKGLYL